MNYKKLSIFLATFIGIFLCFTFVAARISNPNGLNSLTPWTSNIDGGGYNITNIGIASSTSLFVNSKKVSARWKDGTPVPYATTTDEVLKFGNCLEPGGPSVTLDKITGIIASSTNATVGDGISWNINIGSNFFEATDTLFDADINTNSTSTQQSYTPDVTTLPSGYCWWFSPSSASTTEIINFNINLYGYEN